ncbi:MAG: metallophosphoesterase [Lachnospiraceae bacterium]|nr:metallophosphoesterase [Lachnospiraceae bacterium]
MVITIICILAVVCIWIILYDSNRFVVRKHVIQNNKIKKNVRAVVLADLHNKCFGKNNERLLAAIDECQPDFIIVAGDILTAKPGRSLDVAIHIMGKLSEKYPIYYGNGNHEHRIKLYPENYGDMAEVYEKALKEAGVDRLINSHVHMLEAGICIYGSEIDKFFYKRFKIQPMEAEYMQSILGQADTSLYNILIAHNPDYFPRYAEWGADLVCAGHVHGGMVRIPFINRGMVSPNVRFFPKYDGGRFQEGDCIMLLSRGLGMHTIPIRLFNPGEILQVDFEPGYVK